MDEPDSVPAAPTARTGAIVPSLLWIHPDRHDEVRPWAALEAGRRPEAR